MQRIGRSRVRSEGGARVLLVMPSRGPGNNGLMCEAGLGTVGRVMEMFNQVFAMHQGGT